MDIAVVKRLCSSNVLRWTDHAIERMLKRGLSREDVNNTLINGEIMSCFYCKGELEQLMSPFTVEIDNSIIVIKDVPTDTCLKCGQKSYNDIVATRIEAIVGCIRNTNAEIVVTRYSSACSVA